MWIVYSTTAMLLLGSMLLILKKASLAGAPASVILFWLFVGGAIGTGCHLLATRQSPRMEWMVLGMMGVAALLSYLGNLAYIKAMGTAPNPGYPAAIEGCKAALVLVLSVFLFDTGFSLPKAMGVAFCGVGVFLIAR